MLVLLIVSAAVVAGGQFAPAYESGSPSGVDTARVSVPDSISNNPAYANLFESSRLVPQDTARLTIRQPQQSQLPGRTTDSEPLPKFGAPQEPVPTAEEEIVAEIVVEVPNASIDPSEPPKQPLVLRPTFSWVNVFSDSSNFNGEPVQVGDVITAFDPNGTLVGRFVVVKEGSFGLMALYEDDPTTSVDEGAVAGDEISFEINGIPAVVIGENPVVWSSNGAIMLSNLSAAG